MKSPCDRSITQPAGRSIRTGFSRTPSWRKSSTLVPAACCPWAERGSSRIDDGIRSVVWTRWGWSPTGLKPDTADRERATPPQGRSTRHSAPGGEPHEAVAAHRHRRIGEAGGGHRAGDALRARWAAPYDNRAQQQARDGQSESEAHARQPNPRPARQPSRPRPGGGERNWAPGWPIRARGGATDNFGATMWSGSHTPRPHGHSQPSACRRPRAAASERRVS